MLSKQENIADIIRKEIDSIKSFRKLKKFAEKYNIEITENNIIENENIYIIKRKINQDI